MKTSSFRLKIALLSVVISGLVLAAFGGASWYLLYRQKIEAVDTELRALGTRHPGWFANRANFDRLSTSLQFIFGEEHKGQVIFLVKDAEGRTLYVSPGWPKGMEPDKIECSLEDDAAWQVSLRPTLRLQSRPDRRGGRGAAKGAVAWDAGWGRGAEEGESCSPKFRGF